MTVFIDVPEADWGGATTADIGAVVRSVAQCLEGALSERPMEAIRVEPTPTVQEDPITLFKRVDTGHIRVLLNMRGCFWAQLAYQFAHELCHVLANFREPFHHSSKWIEESLYHTRRSRPSATPRLRPFVSVQWVAGSQAAVAGGARASRSIARKASGSIA